VGLLCSAQQDRVGSPSRPRRGYTVQTPGQLPTYVNPNLGGGYTIQTPGALPTRAHPLYPRSCDAQGNGAL